MLVLWVQTEDRYMLHPPPPTSQTLTVWRGERSLEVLEQLQKNFLSIGSASLRRKCLRRRRTRWVWATLRLPQQWRDNNKLSEKKEIPQLGCYPYSFGVPGVSIPSWYTEGATWRQVEITHNHIHTPNDNSWWWWSISDHRNAEFVQVSSRWNVTFLVQLVSLSSH